MASPHQESLVVDSGVSPVETDDPTSKASASDSATMLEKEKLEVDDGKDEGTIEVPTSSSSISSRIYEHVEEHGRTYHKFKQGRYLVPNDELEQNRLDMQHQICKMSLQGKLHLVPLKKETMKHALDFATGTGIWAIDFAQQYPNTKVIGSDLSPIQPEFIPSNLTFEIADMDDSWNYPHQFSYIHGRLLALAFLNPISVFHKVYAALEPGGYFEMQEGCSLRSIDSTVSGTTLEKLYNLIVLAAAKRGADVDSGEKYKEMMQQVGFEDVVEQRFEWPIGTWAKGSHYKKIGAWFREDLSMGLEGFAMVALTRVLGMKKEEVDELVKGAKEDMENGDIHGYQPFIVVYGRKPFAKAETVVE